MVAQGQGFSPEEGLNARGHKEFLGWWKGFIFNCGDGHMVVFICQAHQILCLISMHFVVCKLYLNKLI